MKSIIFPFSEKNKIFPFFCELVGFYRSILFDYISILLHPHKYGLDLVDAQVNSDNPVHGEGLRETDGDETVVIVTP